DLVKTEMRKQNRQINIENLSDGIYMVEIKSKAWTRKQKLIIQK
ncbi:MAG: T9SS type A sorting domain-containing protein, partial [Sphingobacteriia bacterium]|nr:T9SS type A sorting domain-containing protein [Sphingobacteriia bacterium]